MDNKDSIAPHCSGGTLLTWVTRKKANDPSEKSESVKNELNVSMSGTKLRKKQQNNKENNTKNATQTNSNLTVKNEVDQLKAELQIKREQKSELTDITKEEDYNFQIPLKRRRQGSLNIISDDGSNVTSTEKPTLLNTSLKKITPVQNATSFQTLFQTSEQRLTQAPAHDSPPTQASIHATTPATTSADKTAPTNITVQATTPPQNVPQKTTRTRTPTHKITPTHKTLTSLQTTSPPKETKRRKRIPLAATSFQDKSMHAADVKSSQNTPTSKVTTTSVSRSLPELSETHALGMMQGLRIVLTGVFESCSREEMIDHIKRNCGMCTTAVSGRTNLLVTGSILEDNRPVEEGKKYQKAKELQNASTSNRQTVQILTEKEFLQKFPLTPVDESHMYKSSTTMMSDTMSSKYIPSQSSQPLSLSQRTIDSTLSQEPLSISVERESLLWTEKWRPKKLSDLMGNQDVAQKIVSWLNEWKERISVSNTINSQSKEQKGRKRAASLHLDKNFPRAALLSGPPGIGKTSMVHVLASECGYDVIEYNASDDRGKSIVEVISDMASGGNTLKAFSNKSLVSNTLLVMDEMDGLSQGDRGGAQALLKLIEKTRCPVICICNDRYHPKLRTLASKCYDLTLHKPRKNVIAKRLCELMIKEGLKVEYNAVESLCENVGNDIRIILNTLQYIAQTSSVVTYDAIREELSRGVKDRQVMDSIFEVTKRLLMKSESSKMSFDEKLYGYFTDYDMLPLSMQENYINSFLNLTNKSGNHCSKTTLNIVADVSECFTFGDIMNTKCRRENYWTLLGDIGVYTVLIPSCKMSGFVSFPDFPKWLGRNSATAKNRRLLNEISLLTSAVSSLSPVAMQTSGYNQLLYTRLLEPLVDSTVSPQEAALKTINILQEYGLSKEHLTEHLHCLKFKSLKDVNYDNVSTSMKRTLTNLANSNAALIRIAPTALKSKQITTPVVVNEEGHSETFAPTKEETQDYSEQLPAEDETEALLNKLISTKKKKKKTTVQSKFQENDDESASIQKKKTKKNPRKKK